MSPPLFIELPLPFAKKSPPLRAVLSTIHAGDMGPSWDNSNPARRSLLSELGVAPERLVTLRQEHTKLVYDAASVSSGGALAPIGAPIGDGLVTQEKDLVLGVTVADCLPVFFRDMAGDTFGLVHSGWKGTGIALNSAEKIKADFGVPPENLGAFVGPGIGPCCYHVDQERALIFAAEWGGDTVTNKDGRRYLDLKRANMSMLLSGGLREVSASPDCTSCSRLLGSYRRQGPETFSRMIALIGFF